MKPSIILLACFGFATHASGQFYFDLESGYNFPDGKTFLEKPKPDFSYGLGVHYVTPSKFFFCAGVLYDQREEMTTVTYTDASGNVLGESGLPVESDYFAFPLKAGYKFGDKFFGYGSVGVIPAFLREATVTVPLFNAEMIQAGDTSIELSDANEFDISGLAEAGTGYQFTDRLSAALSFRYQYSFRALIDPGITWEIRNRGFSLFLALSYNLSTLTSKGIE